jgi:RHS repeat-associated protein
LNCDQSVDWLDVDLLEDYLDDGDPQPVCCYWECLDNMTFYIYSGGNVATQFMKNQDITHSMSYVYGPNGIICAYIDSSGPYFYLTDHLGSTRMVIDTMRHVLADYYYLPTGDAPNEIPWVENVETPFKFSGKELDNAGSFNQYYFGTRYYDPFLCRWKQVDPAGQFASPYSYGGGRLLSGTDPDGNVFFLVPLIMPTIFGALQGGIMSAACGGNFWEGLGYGALGGALGGGISAIGGAYSQSLAFNVMSRVAVDAGVTAARGGSYGLSNLAGSIAGAGLASTMPEFTGLKSGGWAANAGAEIAFDAMKGAYVGAFSAAIGATVGGGDMKNAVQMGFKGGAIGGAVTASVNIGMMGPTWSRANMATLSDDRENVENLMGGNRIMNSAGRRGHGLIKAIQCLAGDPRMGISLGRHVVVEHLDRQTYIEELIHSYQFMESGIGKYEAMNQQLKAMWKAIMPGDYYPYNDVGSAEYKASTWAKVLIRY